MFRPPYCDRCLKKAWRRPNKMTKYCVECEGMTMRYFHDNKTQQKNIIGSHHGVGFGVRLYLKYRNWMPW